MVQAPKFGWLAQAEMAFSRLSSATDTCIGGCGGRFLQLCAGDDARASGVEYAAGIVVCYVLGYTDGSAPHPGLARPNPDSNQSFWPRPLFLVRDLNLSAGALAPGGN